MSINYKFTSGILIVALMASWCMFMVYSIINGSSIDMIKAQRDDIRRLQNEIISLEIQLTDIHTRQRSLQERIETINQLRVRDYEFINSQINNATVRSIKR
jgi:hypothetical protein